MVVNRDSGESSGPYLIHLKFAKLPDREQYCLHVEPESQSVTVEARGAAGVFYGIQSLLALVQGDRVPEAVIKDEPRFQYRYVFTF